MLLFRSTTESSFQVKQAPQSEKSQPQAPQERQEFAKEMATYTPSEMTKSLQNKNVSVYSKDDSFLGQMKEALLLNRMGVSKEKVDELRAKLDELDKLLANGTISQEEYQEQRELIEKEMTEEYQKGAEREKDKPLGGEEDIT
ncbi:hypothetical protein PCIT_a0627 [Pseudoalteromonas citrea]|uniref:SHOCT domain-containing protein n=2 Tax=Pseudoalteromonas citrea TaxID=43655 RepID=A0AAD4FT89_9GAMM|nr:SHOCT domain-containing protein [Pseudoalteromonas citrea]KAF7774220.1 hypothetical protein PCIT_a0627 [Pseudoalteromonas citrea]